MHQAQRGEHPPGLHVRSDEIQRRPPGLERAVRRGRGLCLSCPPQGCQLYLHGSCHQRRLRCLEKGKLISVSISVEFLPMIPLLDCNNDDVNEP